MKENLLEMEAEHRRLRRIAFIAVAVSTVAVFSSVITLPIVYSYLQGLQTHIGAEVDFCKFKSRDMWLEVSAVQDTMAENSSTRQRRSIPVDQRSKRAWMFGKWMDNNYETVQSPRPVEGYGASSSSYGSPTPPPVSGYDAPVVNSEPLIQQCTCQFGPPGEAGEPGDDGIDGKDGAPGLDGADGREGQILAPTQAHNEPCMICPVGSPGPAGAPGAKGPPGPKGAPGLQAPNGKNGDPGMVGSAGPTGRAGREGPRGQPGAPGIVRIVPGPLGPPGAQGPPGITGLKGPTGAPGSPGKTGEPGLPGEQGLPGLSGREGPHGDKGPIGSPGPKGECNCPPPRLPPGY